MTLKINGATGGSVSLDAPDNTSPAGTDVTLTLPVNDGDAGQYLQTDGTGTLSWQTVASDAITEGNTSVECVDTGSNGTITFTTEGSARATVDSNGKLLVGTTTALRNADGVGIQIRGGTNDCPYVILGRNELNPADGNTLSVIRFTDSNGNAGAQMLVNPDGNWTSGTSHPTRISLSTAPSGSTGAVEQMRLTSTGDLRFNSGYGSAATAYGVRAWGNFVGSGGSPGIRGSGNFSSLSDLGTGDYRLNFDIAMPDANYCVVATAGSSDGSVILVGACPHYGENLTTRVRISTRNSSFTATDAEWLHVAVFR